MDAYGLGLSQTLTNMPIVGELSRVKFFNDQRARKSLMMLRSQMLLL